MRGTIRFNPHDRLLEAAPKPLGQRVPEPLHQRLLQLCDAVYDSGEPQRPTKADMLAALILAAPEDAGALVELLRVYGKAQVKDALMSVGDDAEVIELTTRTSGPRRGGRR